MEPRSIVTDIASRDHLATLNCCSGFADRDAVHHHPGAGLQALRRKLVFRRNIRLQNIALTLEADLLALAQISQRYQNVVGGMEFQHSVHASLRNALCHLWITKTRIAEQSRDTRELDCMFDPTKKHANLHYVERGC
jgi:hypothetical protein